jgi:hypothetical protein
MTFFLNNVKKKIISNLYSSISLIIDLVCVLSYAGSKIDTNRSIVSWFSSD